MKNESSLEARIRSIRQGFRAGQPLEHRIALVRERHKARRKPPVRRIEVHLDRYR